MPLNAIFLGAKKSLRSPKAPQIFLVDQVNLFAAEAWEGCVCATWKWLTYIVATLGYNLENMYLRSSVAQNISFHNAFEI